MNEEDKYMTLEELEPILGESGYICLGHGIGRSGNTDETVNLIFKKGLRTKNNSLYFTTMGLSTPTPEMIKYYEELGIVKPSISTVKQELNNWKHEDSKKIIIARIPIKYINQLADSSDIGGERYGAFMTQEVNENGNITTYLNSKFIVGCYDVQKEKVRMNKNFEKDLSISSLEELKQRYEKMVESTQTRINKCKV